MIYLLHVQWMLLDKHGYDLLINMAVRLEIYELSQAIKYSA